MDQPEKQTFYQWLNTSPSVQIFLVFLIIFFGAIAYYLKGDTCENVTTYSVNYIHPSFLESREEIIAAAKQAEFVWEVETLSDIFKYKEDAQNTDIEINLSPQSLDDPVGEFDKGYHQKGLIVIHQYYDINDLTLVLAHEFGHALGIKEHVEDETAVMNAFLDKVPSFNLRLHPDDIAAIKSVCGVF